MTRIAIHQPNYLPWLGYFYKAAQADVLVLLDDVQFPKHSYTNRVKIGAPNGTRWLTVPVNVTLGMQIREVTAAQPDWRKRHLDILRQTYREAGHYAEVMAWLEQALSCADNPDLASVNTTLIGQLLELLSIPTRIENASTFGLTHYAGDERLVRLVRAIDPSGHYLSGSGGQNYQDENKFAQAGLGFEYVRFDHPVYARGEAEATAGLSIVDALFHAGVTETAQWLRRPSNA